MDTLHVYTMQGFDGHWPVGTTAVVVARTRIAAAKILEQILVTEGLKQTIDHTEMIRLDTSKETAIILNNGNY